MKNKSILLRQCTLVEKCDNPNTIIRALIVKMEKRGNPHNSALSNLHCRYIKRIDLHDIPQHPAGIQGVFECIFDQF